MSNKPTKVLFKRNSTANTPPTADKLVPGELALNTADGKIFTKTDGGVVIDTGKQIFERNTNVTVNDDGTNPGYVVTNVDGTPKFTIDPTSATLDADLVMVGGKVISLHELVGNGTNKVNLSAPDDLPLDYTLKFPQVQGTAGQVMAIGEDGQLGFVAPDRFGGNRVYVSADRGDDANDGVNAPVKSVKRAAQIASELIFEHTGTPATGAANARVLLFKNKEFIKAEVAAWIDYNYVNFDSHYNSTTCERDIGLIVDAVSYDLITGSNFASSVAGMAYYRIQSGLVTSKQLIQTISAITYAKTRALTYVQSAQTTATTAAFDNVISILNGNGLPAFTFPDDSHTDTNGHNSAATLQTNRTSYQTAVETYLDTNYHTLWSSLSAGQKLTCKRDVGYLVDAVTYDILYGGNYQSIIAGNAYYSFGTLEIAAGEKAATLAAYNYLKSALQADVHASYSTTVGDLIDDITTIIDTNVPATTIYPTLPGSGTLLTSYNALQAGKSTIQSDVTTYITATFSTFTYGTLGTTAGAVKSARDAGLVLDGAIFDMYFGGNEKSREYGLSFYNGTATYLLANEKTICVQALTYAKTIAQKITTNTEVVSPYQTVVTQVRDSVNYGTNTNATAIGAKYDIAIGILANGAGTAPTLDPGAYRIRGVSIRIAPGNYFENNPIIVPDAVSIIGDDLRSAVVRPLNANKDIFRVRNGVYMNGFTFRDHVTTAGVPDYTWRYTHAFDDVYDTELNRAEWTWIGNAMPIIQQSPYVQNCSIVSFLGGSGMLIDGSKVQSPNIPKYQIEAENPAVGDTPEQGKSMVGNAYTMLSFGGTGWQVINNAYSQIVGCFQIFLLNGIYAQSGGYISVTNSATNFGTFALRSSGYSDKSFTFDRGIIAANGSVGGAQTLTIIGTQRVPLVQYVLRFFNPSNGADITNSYKSSPTVVPFNAATALTLGSSVFTISSHGFFTGNSIYYSRNGNAEINGLSDNAIYYVQVANINQFVLYNDDSFKYPVTINAPGTGTQQLIKNPEEFYVNDISSSHTSYQRLILAGDSYTFVPGRAISATVDIYQANAYVYSWDPLTAELIISNELTNVNGSDERILFTVTSTINQDHAPSPATAIVINNVYVKTGLTTATIFPHSTIEGGTISSIGGLPEKKIAFHRPSIVNSSAHTWEYAGSGTDYNALPQNGGVPNPNYEQYSEAPGRVYVSGTNELGDFKVGNFITAENRSGLITFKSKVTVGELNVLKLTLSSVQINQISADVGLGDNEPGGASNQRLPTQKAVRSFLANRLGSVIDKSVSTNSVPGSLVQLNASGQINSDLLPPQKAAITYQVGTWNGRLSLYNQIPPIDIGISDQANEKYYQQTLTLSNTVSATIGQVVTQTNRNGRGVVKYVVASSNQVTIANVTGTFSTNSIDHIFFDGVDSGYYPTNAGTAVEQSETYYLALDNKSQFLLVDSGSHTFTVGNTVQAVSNLATGEVTEYRPGVLYSVNNTGINGGTGYQPGSGSVIYNNVPLTNITGSGTGARADVTVTGGAVTNVAVNFGGSGYAVGNVLSANSASVGGTSTVTFEITVNRADNRLYVDLNGNNIKFLATSLVPDYIEDDNATSKTITDLTYYSSKTFNAVSTGGGGSVDYSLSRITINSHGFTSGDPVYYTSGVNTAIGNLVSSSSYFAKAVDSNNIELYTNYNLTTKISFGLTSTGTHNISRYNVNTDNFFLVVPGHNYTTGTPVRITGSTPPGGIVNNEYFFIGSVTTNAFTLHASRADALASITGITSTPLGLTSTGAGSLTFITQNVQINGTLNTSSKDSANWNNLTSTTIDASGIVSGVINPSRLGATGTANNQTFLRGDSSWAYATASAKPAADSPITISGDFDIRAGTNYYHGDLTFDINKIDPTLGATYTNYGVASFNKSQFTITSTGQVSITQGVVDAATLGGFSGSYYLTPSNFIAQVPITKGGTNLTTYSKGDILFAPSTNTLAQLNIGSTGQILNVDASGIPAWSDNANLPGYLNVQSTTQSNLTTNGSITTAGGVGIAKNLNVGQAANITGDITGTGALTVNSADKNVSLQPTGTGTVTINPATKGAINNVDIGATTQGSAKFTTLEASGNTKVTSNTTSSSTTTGALVVNGGVGIGENLNVYGNAIVSGNLTINGTTTTVNSTTVTIEDPIIVVGGGVGGAAPTTPDSLDRGIAYQYYNGSAKIGYFGLKTSDGYFEFIPDATLSGNTVTGALGDIKAATFRGNLTSSSVTITGGTINNTSIGATNTSTGAFTTLTASDSVTFTKNTDSTDTSTGTLVVTGGVGVSGKLNSGSIGTGALTATGAVSLDGANVAISLQPTGTGTVTIKPNTTGAMNNMVIGAVTAKAGTFTDLTANASVSMSPSGIVTINPTTAGSIDNMSIGATTKSSGGFTSLTANAAVTLTQNTASTNTTSGTLVVTGGVGVSGAVNIGSTINAGAATFTNVTDSGLTSGRVTFAGTGGLLSDSSSLTYASGTLTVGTSIIAGGVTVGTANITLTGGNITGAADITATGTIQGATLIDTGLTSGRVTYATTNGQLADNSGFTFNSGTTTLTITNASIGALTATTSASFSPSGTVTINPTVAGTINNMAIGGTTAAAGKFTSVTDTGLTSGRITFATTGGLLTDSSTLTWDGTVLTAGSFSTSGALSAGATTVTTLTASGVVSITDSTESTSTTTGALKVSGGVGIVKNIWVGGNSNVAGTFKVQSTFTADAAVNLNPANYSVGISPTGTGSVTINPNTAGTINNMSIGATTRSTGAFTTLDANSTVGLSPANNSVTISPTGTGSLTVNPNTAGTINNMSIGATTAAAGRFTTLTATTSATLSPTGTVTINPTTKSNIDNVDIGVTTAGTGAFTTLDANSTVTFSSTTDSSSSTTGAVKIAGGVGIAKKLYVGTNLSVTGTTTLTDTLTANGTVDLNPANYSVSISPTGTGSVTVNPTVTGSINNMIIGASVAKAGTFTNLTATGTLTANTTNNNVTLGSGTGSGSTAINSGSTGTINNISVGATTASTGKFTTLQATTSADFSPSGTVTINPTTKSNIDNVDIGTTTAGSAKFTTISGSGQLSVTSTTESTDTITGSIITAGGLGVAKNANVGGNLVITGNLTVNGTTTTVNSTVSTVEDPIMDIGGGIGGAAPTSNDSKDRGITFQYYKTDGGGSAKRGFFGFDAATGYFKYIKEATLTNEVASGTLADIQAGYFRGNVAGGTGTFTTLSSNDTTTFTKDSESTTLSTGAVQITGGTAVGKNLNVGGTAKFGLNSFNSLSIVGSQTGSPVTINAIGSDTSVNITLVPQGNQGIVAINAVTALQIPVGASTDRPSNPVNGLVRFNTTSTQFEGYNGIGWSSLGGVRDVAGKTYIIPELTPGSHDKTLYFYAENAGGTSFEAGTWTSDLLQINSPGFRVPTGNTSARPSGLYGEIRFNTETLQFEGFDGTNWASMGGVRSPNGTTYIDASNTELDFYVNSVLKGTVTSNGFNLGNIRITGNTVSAINTNGNVNLTADGTGVVAVTGVGALRIPAGTTAEQPGASVGSVTGSAGWIRYNTDIRALELWSQASSSYVPVTGTSSAAGDTKITFETAGNDEKVIRFYVGNALPFDPVSGSTEIAYISKDGFFVDGTTIKTQIVNGTIQTATSDTSLTLKANGNGTVIVDDSFEVTGHVKLEGVTSTGATGTGKIMFNDAPTITGHPTIEGVTATGATGTGGLVFSNAPTISGTLAAESITASGTLNVTGHVTVEGVTSTGATGTGKFVFDTSPTITTPSITTPTITGATVITDTATGPSYTLKVINGNVAGSVFGIGTGNGTYGIANDALNNAQNGYVPYTVSANTITFKTGASVPATALGINSSGLVTIGALTVSTSASLSPSGTVTINPGTLSSVDNVNIGATTPGTGAFTTLTSNSLVVNGRISIHDNVIENTYTNDDLIIRANGTGRVIIDGSGTSANSGNVFATDPLLTFNSGLSGTANTYDAGFIINRGTNPNVGLVWSESAGEFRAISTLEQGTVKGSVSVTAYQNVSTNTVKLNSETATKLAFVDSSKYVRSLDTGRSAVVDGTLTFNSAAQLNLPTGSNSQRPGSATTGSVRYNTDSQIFEGYGTAGWQAMGVGVGTGVDYQSFTGDGTTYQFTLQQTPLGAGSIMVVVNGIVQQPGTSYQVVNNILSFADTNGNTFAPEIGDSIDVRFLSKPSVSSVREYNYTGDGSNTTFSVDFAINSVAEVMVFVNNIYQDSAVYTYSGTNVIFTQAPFSNERVCIVHLCAIIAPNVPTIQSAQDDAIAFSIALG
jgi:hypothetical protein